MITTVVVSLGVGGVIVERLTRPVESLAPLDVPAPRESAGRREPLAPPPPARPNNVEMVDEALALADELAESFADDDRALALSARLSYFFRRYEQARDRWLQSIKLNPQSGEAWQGLAELARQEGDFQKGVDYMRRLAEVNPRQAREKVFILADCLLKLGEARQAVDALEEAGKSTPLPGWAQVMLGDGYYRLKQYERAADRYRQALDDPQQAVVAHYGLSQALMRLGRQEEARKVREKYAALQKENMVVFDRMQKAGTQEERHDPAKWYPILAGFHCDTGAFYARRGQTEQARKHWMRAWALAPERPEARQLLEVLERL